MAKFTLIGSLLGISVLMSLPGCEISTCETGATCNEDWDKGKEKDEDAHDQCVGYCGRLSVCGAPQAQDFDDCVDACEDRFEALPEETAELCACAERSRCEDVKEGRCTEPGSSGGSGGTYSSGGSHAGGTSSQGGSHAGGTSSQGGSPDTGGTTSQGGSPDTGGTSSQGGAPGTGGLPGCGGSMATGGSASGGSDAGGAGGEDTGAPCTCDCDCSSGHCVSGYCS